MTLPRILILALVIAFVAAVAGATQPQAASAQMPCWKVLLNDWYDGRIDDSYPVRCYREAIRNLPDDVDAYTAAREDIQRALLAALRRAGGELQDDDLVPPEPPPAGAPGSNGENGDDDQEPREDGEPSAAPGGNGDDGGLVGFFRPSNADAIPLPLILLAGLAVLLLLMAAGSFVARRIQARRLRPAPARNRPAPPDS